MHKAVKLHCHNIAFQNHVDKVGAMMLDKKLSHKDVMGRTVGEVCR
jgi:hypothetical protein